MQVELETQVKQAVDVKRPYRRQETGIMPIGVDRAIPYPGTSYI